MGLILLSIRKTENSSWEGRDLYGILEVTQNASTDEIKTAYHRLNLKYHPDKNPQNLEESNEKFQLICHAYSILSDIRTRQHFDTTVNDPRGERHFCQISLGGRKLDTDLFSLSLLHGHIALQAAEPNKSSHVKEWQYGVEDKYDPIAPILSHSQPGMIFCTLGKPIVISAGPGKFRKKITSAEMHAAFQDKDKFMLVYSDHEARRYARAMRVGNFYQDQSASECPIMKVKLVKPINHLPVRLMQAFIAEAHGVNRHTSSESIYYVVVDKSYFVPLSIRLHIKTLLEEKLYPDVACESCYSWQVTHGLFGVGARPVLKALNNVTESVHALLPSFG